MKWRCSGLNECIVIQRINGFVSNCGLRFDLLSRVAQGNRERNDDHAGEGEVEIHGLFILSF